MKALWARLRAALGLASVESHERLRAEADALARETAALAARLRRLGDEAYAHAPVIRIHQGSRTIH